MIGLPGAGLLTFPGPTVQFGLSNTRVLHIEWNGADLMPPLPNLASSARRGEGDHLQHVIERTAWRRELMQPGCGEGKRWSDMGIGKTSANIVSN